MRMFWMPTEKTVRIEETNIRQPNKKKEARKIHWKKKRFWKRRWVINSSEPQRKERNYYVKRLLSPNL